MGNAGEKACQCKKVFAYWISQKMEDKGYVFPLNK